MTYLNHLHACVHIEITVILDLKSKPNYAILSAITLLAKQLTNSIDIKLVQ